MINRYLHYYLPFLVFIVASVSLSAQKVMQIEKYGRAKTEKIFIGQAITYKVKNDEAWRFAYIEDILVEENIVQLGTIYVKLENIEAIRYDRSFSRKASHSLLIFGASWSLFAAIGTATDGNPETHYQWSDAIVTGTSALFGWLMPKVFRYKIIRFGKKKRLRLLDLGFKKITP